MAEPQTRSAPEFFSKVEFFSTLGGVVVIAAVTYWGIGLLRLFEALKDSRGVVWAQYIASGFFLIAGVVGTIDDYRERAKARKTVRAVDEALEEIKKRKDMANVSAQEVRESMPDSNLKDVKDAQLTTLVEQRRQRFLIDDEYFKRELSHLIVDYLQPLPRNAKRVVNRFRVELLIADDRGLLKGDSRAMAQRIGKWLVLVERWPQLGRALAAAPDKMGVLERDALKPVLPPQATPVVAAAGVTGTAAATTVPVPPAPVDPFSETVRALAPFYVGDEDLRKFVLSPPPLAGVLESLVNLSVEEAESKPATAGPPPAPAA